jgi:hypothetical protein
MTTTCAEVEELVAAVPEVADLTLERCPHLTNLAPLASLQHLVRLSLEELPSVADLLVLSSLRSVSPSVIALRYRVECN